jgi:hypothetical protein
MKKSFSFVKTVLRIPCALFLALRDILRFILRRSKANLESIHSLVCIALFCRITSNLECAESSLLQAKSAEIAYPIEFPDNHENSMVTSGIYQRLPNTKTYQICLHCIQQRKLIQGRPLTRIPRK